MARPFFISLILFLSLHSTAQQYNFKTYSVDQGLVQSQVLSISQDKNGFIWIATQGGGVSKFDGHSFKNYTIYEGLPSNHVWKIYCDTKGNVWAGTSEGLAIFKDEKFERVKSTYGLRDDQIWDILEDSKGNMLFGTKNYGVFIYDGVTYKNYAINDGLGFSSVSRLYEDKDGNIWIGSFGYGLAKFNGTKFENVTQRMKLSGLIISEIYTDIKGNLIVCSDDGMFKLQGEVFIPYEKEFDTRSVTSVKTDKNKNTWYATYGDGLISEDENGHTFYYTEDNGLPSNYLFGIYIGSSDKLWVATDGAGLARFDDKKFIHYNKTNILKNNIVKSIAVTPDSSYWFATEIGLTRYFPSNGKVIYYDNSNGLVEENVHCLDVSPAGILWAGTESGIIRIDWKLGEEKFRYFQVDGGTYSIFVENENKIWAGTDDGIMLCNGSAVYKRFIDSIPDLRVNRIKKSKRNEILFCTDISFSIYDGKKLNNYKIADTKGSKEIIDVWEMNDRTFWLATNRGITVIDKKFDKTHITTREGLSSDNLYLICFFDNGIWVGGDRGLDKITLDKYGGKASIKHYDKEDGFTGVECNLGSYLMESDKIWIGTIKGVTVYQPKYDLPNKVKPKLHLLEIRLNYELVNWSDLFPGMEMEQNIPKNLKLSHDQNNLLFEFIAIDFTNPEKIRYQFMLEGFNETWLPVTTETSVSYTNLPPGKYVFKIKARNSDGVWSNVLKYEFEIGVPFWRSTLFLLILIPSVMIAIYVFILLRTRQLNRTKRKLEETVRLRTLELNKQKNELEKLSIVADKMTDGVVICSPDGKIEWINDGFKRMTGFTLEEFSDSVFGGKKRIQEISSHKEIEQILQGFKKEHNSVIYDSTHKTKDGNLMWTRAALTPIYNDKNELIKIVALYSDITDHIRYEETLAQTNKDLTDSIVYAKKIQEAILPDRKSFDELYPDNFIYYNPRDIVSGDFYWYTKINGMLVIAVADCTGHGVPGAFMSMIGNEFLHQIINIASVTHPDLILHQLNERVRQALHQDGGDNDSRDGMDVALCTINLTNQFCRFAGAHLPMFLIRNGELMEFEAAKESIGGHNELEKVFLLHELNLQKGDCIYFSTDGYTDQFGGNDGKKLMRKRFKELLKRYAHLPMKDQYAMLYELHHDWRGSKKQTDDILIVGIRITE